MATYRTPAQQAALRKAQKAALLKALRAYPNGIPVRQKARQKSAKRAKQGYSTPGYIGQPIKKARDVPYIGSKVSK